jgi:hypothetical protein
MQGFGIFPFGITPAGFWVPDEWNTKAPPPSGAEIVDPVKRDMVVGDDGHTLRTTGARQRVTIGILTSPETSAAMPSLGIQKITHKTTDYQRTHEQNVRRGLRHLQQDVAVTKVTVPEAPRTRVDTRVEFTDLTTGKPDHEEL